MSLIFKQVLVILCTRLLDSEMNKPLDCCSPRNINAERRYTRDCMCKSLERSHEKPSKLPHSGRMKSSPRWPGEKTEQEGKQEVTGSQVKEISIDAAVAAGHSELGSTNRGGENDARQELPVEDARLRRLEEFYCCARCWRGEFRPLTRQEVPPKPVSLTLTDRRCVQSLSLSLQTLFSLSCCIFMN